MKNIKTGLFVLMLLFLSAINVAQAEPYMSQIIKAELDQFNTREKSVVINGKKYQLSLDASLSSYITKEDQNTLVKTFNLKSGESYFFEMIARGNDMRNSNYTDIVFISTREPSE